MLSIKLKCFILLLFICIFSTAFAQLKPHDAIAQMRKGINLGNTHEPPTEGGWNNPRAEEYYFDLYKEAGFQIVRIPVRWDNYTSKFSPYQIDSYWLNRIEQVVDWGLKRGLFIVINAHHDDWIKNNYSEENKARFDSIWVQVSQRFRDKSEKLLFEIINEPYGLNRIQNDDLHARILSIIRKTNPTRLVIFQGHNWGGSDELLTAAVPDDEYVIGSFHSYDPYLFGLEGQGTWGSTADYNQLERKFKEVADWSEQNNVPVFLGEFGAIRKGDYNSRMRHYRAYSELSQKYGFTPVVWDDGGDFRIMEREQKRWNEIKDILIYTSARSPKPFAVVQRDSVIQVSWTAYTSDHDSIIVQQKLGTQFQFSNIAVLPPDAKKLDIEKPEVNKYYDFRIIAHYNDSAALYSEPVRLFFPEWVRPVRKPFNDTLHVIPGIIETEDFDEGGEGFTYHDSDNINLAGKYRTDVGVDIYERPDGGFHVGNTMPGEWLEYSVDVAAEGLYNVSAYIATYYGGGKFQIDAGSESTGPVTVETSNSSLNTLPNNAQIYLHPGEQIIRFTILEGPSFNIDKFVFESLVNSSGIKTGNIEAFTIYQSFGGALIIRQAAESRLKEIRISDINGKVIDIIKEPSEQIMLSTVKYKPGLYLVTGISESSNYIEKVFIY